MIIILESQTVIWESETLNPESGKTLLHAKFQEHRTSGSGEEAFLRFLPYMSMAAILVM